MMYNIKADGKNSYCYSNPIKNVNIKQKISY